jgi:hypothetical protein
LDFNDHLLSYVALFGILHVLLALRCAMVAGLILSFFLAGCSNDVNDDVNNDKPPTDTSEEPSSAEPNWYKHVQPIVAENCQRCHSDGNALTFSLENPEVVSALGPSILGKVRGSDSPPFYMPPFNARDTEECAPPNPWRNDLRLSEADIQIFEDWIEIGAPLGDESDAAPFSIPQPSTLEGGDEVQELLSAGQTIQEGEIEDLYRCFSLDPGLDAERWITGLEVLPGNLDVVHHVVLFTDAAGASADLLDAAGGYDCYGGAGVGQSSVLMGWAPGGDVLEFPTDSGFAIPAGGRLVMQIHYHPVLDAVGETADLSGIKVRWADTAPSKNSLVEPYGGIFENHADSNKWEEPPFSVPAGSTDHTETWREPFDFVPSGVDARIWSVFPHMHLIGRDIRVSIEHGDGTETCLTHIPSWDFEWQLSYLYDSPFDELPRVVSTDTLVIRCTFDNSATNPFMDYFLAEAGLDAPIDMGVGEDSLDEMCAVILGVVY